MTFATDQAAQVALRNDVFAEAQGYLDQMLAITDVSFSNSFNIDSILPDSYNYASVPQVGFRLQGPGFAPSISIVSAAPPTAPTASFSTITDVVVPDLTAVAPTLAFPTVPSNTLPTAPGASPSFTSPAIPTAPLITLPTVPTLAALSLPTAPSIDLPVFAALAPDDDLVAPTTEFQFAEAAYESTLLDPLKAILLDNLVNGGYGIETADEVALFNRARDREVEAMSARIADAGRAMAARGFPLPPGELSVHIDRAYQEMQDKVSVVSRDITLERSKLFVENRQFTIREVRDVEQMLLNFHNAVQERALNVARLTVEFSVAIFKALVERYNARLGAYRVEAEVFNDRIRAELAKAEIYRTQVEAVKVSSELQRTQVETYLAQLRGIETSVSVFRVQMDAAKVQAEIERIRLEAYRSQVDAYTAQVQAKVAEFGMYRSQIEGETSKVQAFEAQVRAFTGQVGAAEIKSKIQLGRLQQETEQARIQLLTYQGQLDQYKADVERQVASGQLQVQYYSAATAAAKMLNDGALGQAGLQQEVIKSTTQQNIQISEMTIADARAKLEATVAALKFRTEGTHFASQQFFAVLTQLMSTVNTLAVSTTTA
ncbi:MAG: hypothetical protein PHW66_09635 [Gallionella sp.]|nr:hypothetical protein [Gallionella sp.]